VKPGRVELDYLAPPQRLLWPGLLVLALSLALGAFLLVRYRDARQDIARLEAESGLVLPERRPVRAVPKERLDAEAKAAEAVVRQLAVPWGALVAALEQASMRDVALLQLQPDADQRRLRLTAEARDRDAMFTYLRRLEAAPALAEVVLISHQVQLEDPQRPIQFSLQAALK
jgi:Tfp pilus assembly protein PilN